MAHTRPLTAALGHSRSFSNVRGTSALPSVAAELAHGDKRHDVPTGDISAPARRESSRLLIVLDLELPDTDAFEFLRELEALLFPDNLGTSSPFLPLDLTLSWYPTVSLVVVSERQGYDIFENGGSLENDARLKEVAQIMGEDYESGQILTPRGVLRRALNEGAVGFIPKSASRETMLDAFRSIFAGGHYIPWPPPPLDPCDGPVNPRPLRTPGTAQAVDAVNREAVVADSQRRRPWQS